MEREQRFVGVLYARKSTDTEDKQVRSISIQQTDMRPLAAANDVRIEHEIAEARSAKRPGRAGFEQVIRLVEQGKANCIVTWHPDRLARNAVDGGRIIDLFDQGKLRRIQCYGTSYGNTPHEKMILQTQFVFAKYSNDVLAERISGGMRDKLRRGEYPGKAPLGYVNHLTSRRLVVHRRWSRVVIEAFQRYAAGATLDDIRKFLFQCGIRTKRSRHNAGGKMPGRSFVSRMLSNPIYYGAFDWAGNHYQGSHAPIVERALFGRVQAVLDRRYRYSPSQEKSVSKPFLRLAKCGTCGCSITGEIQKGRIYYRCTKKNPRLKCAEPYVLEADLDKELAAILKSFDLPSEVASDMLARLREEDDRTRHTSEHLIQSRQAELADVERRFSRVKEALFSGLIDPEDADAERRDFLRRKRVLDDDIAALRRGDDIWLEPMRAWIKTAQRIGGIAATGTPVERASAAKEIFGSNLYVEGRKARGKAANPWSLLPQIGMGDTYMSLYAAARTHFQGQRGLPHLESNQTRASREVSPPGDTRLR